MKKLFILLIISSLCIVKATAQPTEKYNDAFLNDIVEIVTKSYQGTPKQALMIGIIQNGKNYVLPFGMVHKAERKVPDETDLFELGTASVLFTSTLLEQLVQESYISTDSITACKFSQKIDVEKVMEDDYENIIQEKIFQTLEMKSTTTKISQHKKYLVLDGHDAKGRKIKNRKRSESGIITTTEDMLKFVKANLNIDYNKVSDALLAAQQPNSHVVKKGSCSILNWNSRIEKTTADDQEVLWMSGGNKGFHTYISLLKNHNTGIVLLSNSAKSTDELGKEIITYFLRMNNTFAKNQTIIISQ